MSKNPTSPRRHQRCVGCGQRKRCVFKSVGYVCKACRVELAKVTRWQQECRELPPRTRYGRAMEQVVSIKYK